ncbi:MAG TPA: hypothetical protein DEB06_03995 [Phycisphaerales bacterium]|nr:hypothetical protein [Phycisphaerales bacterium]
MTPRRATTAGAVLLALLGALGACETNPRPRTEPVAPARPTPGYAEVAALYNARAARLSRVWARAVVSIAFRDQDGTRRSEQGEGHFQFVAPADSALSVGKLGEVYLWVGSDAHRYWLLEPRDPKRGVVGRHELLNESTLDRLGLPAAPLDLLRVVAVTPMPEQPEPPAAVAWSSDGAMLVVDLPTRRGIWRYWLEPRDMLPQVIELIGPGDEVILSASLERYERVTLRGQGGFFPLMPSRVRLTHHESGSTLSLTLQALSDGGESRLTREAFDLDALVALFNIIDLRDADAPTTAPRASAP